jgi:hypothetical protein
MESLRCKAENVRVFELPGAKDLTEWAERGGTRKQLLALIDSVPARERPAAADSAAEETERPKTPTSDETRANCRGGSQATRLVSIAEKAELFHSPDGTAFANVPVGSHRETWQVKSSAFRQFLAREFYLAERAAPNAQAVQAALNVIAARACFDGREETVFVRVAERDGGLWLDLANATRVRSARSRRFCGESRLPRENLTVLAGVLRNRATFCTSACENFLRFAFHLPLSSSKDQLYLVITFVVDDHPKQAVLADHGKPRGAFRTRGGETHPRLFSLKGQKSSRLGSTLPICICR